MGINGLWVALQSVAERVSLQQLAVEHRIKAIEESRADDTLTLGVDMGTLAAKCEGGENTAGLHSKHGGGGLYLFFRRLSEFLHSPLALVFVFDGPDRPLFKRGQAVVGDPEWWIKAGLGQQLLGHHGYRFVQAPGEAEAELAILNCKGLVHGVITSDSDVLVFGAKMVLRPIPQKNRKYPDKFFLYCSETMVRELNLTPEALVMAAISQGGDYNNGIDGCGSKTALALGSCGFGDTLVSAFKELEDDKFKEFLTVWRKDVQSKLITNSEELMSARQPAVAAAISDDYPDLDTLRLYVDPLTGLYPNHALPQFGLPREPCISQITNFAEKHFYLPGQILLKRFSDSFFEGACLQAIYSPLSMYNTSTREVITPFTRLRVREISQETRSQNVAIGNANGPQVKLVVLADDLLSSMGDNFKGYDLQDISVWPPTALLPAELAAGLDGSGRGHLKATFPKANIFDESQEIIDLDSDDEDKAYEYSTGDFSPVQSQTVAPARKHSRSSGFLDLTNPNAQFVEYKVDKEGAIDLTSDD